ncbi:FAD-dependent monooxygenase [Sphingomonas sp. PL-96]|uniref:FAD-dependent oxidoreductase n=1 Tax=Sphingomonas sp. PL-96 TaxID=2887201 RepID=UPI001E413F73|nr:FAD-dependent monooxygenase [Sphingomonas sp. PL-96]MCC2976557.1 FAD-dependent monooxygenase [Sphingomonas sp. PL-96]
MTGQTERVQVVIAGAGPVGCVAATYLAQRGIDVILAETGNDAAQDLRASTFHPPSLEMLDTLGIAQSLIDMGLKAPIYHWRDRRSGEVLSFDLSEIGDVTRFPYRIQCEQYHLARMLAERLGDQPSARVMFGHRVIHFDQDEAGVTVSLEHTTGIKKVRADYLIGADGANSLVRKWLGVEFDGFTYPEHFLCLSTKQPIDAEIPNLAYVNYVSDPEEWLVLLRVPSVWRVLVPASAEEDPAWLLSDAKKNKVFGGLLADGEAVKTEHRTIYRVHQRVAKSFHHNRVLLMGDSAHLNNPLGGFGMNSGIHDAFNGCEKLVRVLNGEAGQEELALYDRQRRTVTHDFTQQQTIENMAIMRAGQGEAHKRKQETMRTLSTDPERRRAYLLRQAMFTSLADAAAIR